MNRYTSLILGIVNAVYAVINMSNQKLDILLINIIICVLCFGYCLED